jgi:hypothetical protein
MSPLILPETPVAGCTEPGPYGAEVIVVVMVPV